MYAILYVGGGYLALIVILYILQDRLLYHPSAHFSGTPSAIQAEWKDVYFESVDGLRLHGWYLPHEESEYAVLFSHGNGGNISDRLQLLDWMNESRISVFIYDYRGYGKSEGTPTEKGLYQDIEAAWRYLTRDQSYDPSQIILFGRSLGGPVSAYLGQNVDAGGLVLESTFTRLKDIASEAYPMIPSRLVRPKFPTLDYLSQSSAPVMVMHSREDPLIGFQHARKLYEKAPEPKTFVELWGGHNNNFVESQEVYFRAWKEFIANLETEM